MLDLWYKNAIVYCLDVDSFMDSDADGSGDFRGLTDRLDHIEALGANCIWLLPFFDTPNFDNGYDVRDFYSVNERLGSLGDFVEFTRAARERGIRVIVDLVVNHTSIEHRWFQSARRDRNSRYRDFYVWSDSKPEDAGSGVVFPGVQDTTWTWDEEAQAYYFHRFYAHQPDLNVGNPEVREEIQRIMGFWLELGVSGFRIDAVPFLIEKQKVEADRNREPFRLLDELHQFLSWRRSEAVMLAEANVPLDEACCYFGDGSRMHMVFHFILNQNMFLAFARQDSEPVAEVLRKAPPLPPISQWAVFLRNHDELDLGRLSDEEREEAFRCFAPDPDMRLYGRGVRRRLAPMFGGDERRVAMANSLMLALPGTPVIWYGEEIGLGENLSLQERDSVRTPMAWNDGRNGGFSEAAEGAILRPGPADGPLGYKRVNVAAQTDRSGSLLERVRRLIRARRACPEIGWGSCEPLDCGDSAVLAIRYQWRGGAVLVAHNFADRHVRTSLDLGEPCDTQRLIVADSDYQNLLEDGQIELSPYGYAWLRLHGERR